MINPPLTIKELLDCMKAGWRCAWVPNTILDLARPGERRCYLGIFKDDEWGWIGSTVIEAKELGLIWQHNLGEGVLQMELTQAGRNYKS